MSAPSAYQIKVKAKRVWAIARVLNGEKKKKIQREMSIGETTLRNWMDERIGYYKESRFFAKLIFSVYYEPELKMRPELYNTFDLKQKLLKNLCYSFPRLVNQEANTYRPLLNEQYSRVWVWLLTLVDGSCDRICAELGILKNEMQQWLNEGPSYLIAKHAEIIEELFEGNDVNSSSEGLQKLWLQHVYIQYISEGTACDLLEVRDKNSEYKAGNKVKKGRVVDSASESSLLVQQRINLSIPSIDVSGQKLWVMLVAGRQLSYDRVARHLGITVGALLTWLEDKDYNLYVVHAQNIWKIVEKQAREKKVEENQLLRAVFSNYTSDGKYMDKNMSELKAVGDCMDNSNAKCADYDLDEGGPINRHRGFSLTLVSEKVQSSPGTTSSK